MLAGAEVEGKAYGLLGLYIKDRGTFDRAVARLKSEPEFDKTLMVAAGCVIAPERLSDLVLRFAFLGSVLGRSEGEAGGAPGKRESRRQ